MHRTSLLTQVVRELNNFVSFRRRALQMSADGWLSAFGWLADPPRKVRLSYASRMHNVIRFSYILLLLALLASCKSTVPSGFIVARADRTISGSSSYPLAVDPSRVGLYPSETKSGSGYFYDDVLEYRVWLHPENGAEMLNGTNDYFVAFAQYERAEAFAKSKKGSESALVLVRQREWIDEPERRLYVPRKDNRITEWQVAWLLGSKRTERSIQEFLKHPRNAKE